MQRSSRQAAASVTAVMTMAALVLLTPPPARAMGPAPHRSVRWGRSIGKVQEAGNLNQHHVGRPSIGRSIIRKYTARCRSLQPLRRRHRT